MFQLLNEIGDAGELRGRLASLSRSIGASVVIADAEGPGLLAKSGKRVRNLDEVYSGAGVLAYSEYGSVSDIRWGRGRGYSTEIALIEAAAKLSAAPKRSSGADIGDE